MDHCSRRQFVHGVGVLGLALVAGCGSWPWQARTPARVPRIGFLLLGSREDRAPLIAGFLRGLGDLGYVDGQNVNIARRFSAEGRDQLRALAAELIQFDVDAIVPSGSQATEPTKQATSTTPIVMVTGGDPVDLGFVASLARPGGNITGLSILSHPISAKRLELLTDILPGTSRIAVVCGTRPIRRRPATGGRRKLRPT